MILPCEVYLFVLVIVTWCEARTEKWEEEEKKEEEEEEEEKIIFQFNSLWDQIITWLFH